jgi:DNA anti-recombination protein RmuC
MSRTYLIILILHLGFFFQGCAPLEYLDGSPKEEIERFKMAKVEMWDEMERLKTENVDLQSQINALSEENQRIRDENEKEMAGMRDENEALNEQINRLKEESQRASEESQVLANKLTDLQEESKAISSESDELKRDIGKLKIKVLSGDGNLNSAKDMAKSLMKMGYRVGAILYAPRSDFPQDTVYFAPEFQEDAKQLLPRLGSNAISKPLTWPSTFDLIIVTGKAP